MESNIYYKRLELFWHSMGFNNANEFALSLGYSRSENITRLKRKPSSKPGSDLISDIVEKYPEINLNWIYTGAGNMSTASDTDIETRQVCMNCIDKHKQIAELSSELIRIKDELIDCKNELLDLYRVKKEKSA